MNMVRGMKAVSLVAVVVSACYQNPYNHGRRVYSPVAQGPVGPAGKDGMNGKSQLYPAGVALDLVNEVDAYLTQDGLNLHSLDTSKRANAPGAFDEVPVACAPNSRVGNKAFVGFYSTSDGLLSGANLSDLKTFSFEARKEDGVTSMVYLNLLVDCNGNGAWDAATDAIVTVSPAALAFPLTDDVFTTVHISVADSVFRSVGGHCGLPNHLAAAGVPLSTLITANPNAKLIATVPRDCGMPLNTKMSPVLLIQGDSATTTTLRTTLRSFSIGMGTKNYMYQFAGN